MTDPGRIHKELNARDEVERGVTSRCRLLVDDAIMAVILAVPNPE